jgi:hypothetical protein
LDEVRFEGGVKVMGKSFEFCPLRYVRVPFEVKLDCEFPAEARIEHFRPEVGERIPDLLMSINDEGEEFGGEVEGSPDLGRRN